jgi:radical SAM protein with 4Fe4S-binding SPASM domain
VIRYLQQIGYAPRSCVWELTLACNLRCKHCGSRAGDRREGELEDHELFRIADELADLGCRRVTLSGGEPTLHPLWDEVGRRLGRRGLKVNLISNGWHWDEHHIRRAKDAGLVGAAFSLDGFRVEHDALRREGSFERVVAAIDRTAAAGFPVAVNTTITKLNQNMFHELRGFLIAHGVFAWQLQFATPTGNMGDHRDIVVGAEDFLWLVPRIAEICRSNTPKFFARGSDDVGYYGRPEQDLRDYDEALPFWVGCRAGCQVIGIESNGDVKGCLSLPSSVNGEKRFVEGNLRTATLEAIWKRPGAFSYNREHEEQDLRGFCSVCRYRDFCRGGCTWTKYTESAGNPYCFYYQAVRAGRLDLLEEEPTGGETAYFRCPDAAEPPR